MKKYLPCRSIYSKAQSHHILPISKGGHEHSSNLIVLCSHHHELVHQGRLEIMLIGKPAKISIKYEQKCYQITPN